jgi:hypothetical protein
MLIIAVKCFYASSMSTGMLSRYIKNTDKERNLKNSFLALVTFTQKLYYI